MPDTKWTEPEWSCGRCSQPYTVRMVTPFGIEKLCGGCEREMKELIAKEGMKSRIWAAIPCVDTMGRYR